MSADPGRRASVIGIVAPAALAAGAILADFGPRGVPIEPGTRSLIVATGVAAVLYLLALLVTRRPDAASTLATFGVIAAWSTPLSVCLGLVLLLAWRVARLHRRTLQWPGRQIATFARSASVIFVATGVIGLATNGSVAAVQREAQPADAGPPIYLILLDAYPRADALAEWGFDNEPFLSALTDAGFDVARSSTSNYSTTQHTLVSMLYMRHLYEIDELDDPPPDLPARLRLLSQLIAKGGSVFTYLRERGYDVATVPSIVQDVTLWGARRLGHAQVNEYEIHLLSNTDLGRLTYALSDALAPGWLEDSYRAGIRDAFRTLIDSQAPGRFIWVHVMSPHPPYLLRADGETRMLPACFPSCGFWARPSERQAELMIDQLRYVNQLVLTTVDEIHDDAVVIVMSDHGAGLEGENPFGTLLALRAPDQVDLLPDDATAVTVLPRVFNAYFDAGLPIPADDHYFSGPGVRIDVQKVP